MRGELNGKFGIFYFYYYKKQFLRIGAENPGEFRSECESGDEVEVGAVGLTEGWGRRREVCTGR